MKSLSRCEHIGDVLVTTDSSAQLPNNGGLIPNNFYLYGLRLEFEGRITVPAAGGGGVIPTAVNADGAYGLSLLNRIMVSGHHKARNQQVILQNLRGPDLFELNRMYNGVTPYAEGTVVVTADAAIDFRTVMDLPFVPLGVGPRVQSKYLLDAPNYDQLKLELFFGNMSSVYTLGTGTPALSAYGSATGSARVRVSRLIAVDGIRKFNGYLPARCVRYFTEVTGDKLTSSGNAVRLYDFVKGFPIRSAILKTGVKATVTGGADAYKTLSNTILSDVRFNVGLDHQIRRFSDFYTLGAENVNYHGIMPSTGFGNIDFVGDGDDSLALQTAPLLGGPEGNTDTYIGADVTGAAGQAMLAIVEELQYTPRNTNVR